MGKNKNKKGAKEAEKVKEPAADAAAENGGERRNTAVSAQSKASERRSSFFRKFVDTSKGKIHYILRGPDDGELVVLLHGMSISSFLWDDISNELDKCGFRSLAFDFSGRGYSDAPSGKYDCDFFVDQTVELLKELGLWLEPVTIAGWSMGAAVGCRFAQLHPSKVRRLAMFSPVGLTTVLPGPAKFTQTPVIGAAFAKIGGKNKIKDYNPLYDFHNPEACEDAIRVIQEKHAIQFGRTKSFVSSYMDTLANFSWTGMDATFKEVGEHSRPVFVVMADKDMLTPPEATTKAVGEAMPKAKLKVCENSGHCVVLEKAQESADALLALMSEDVEVDISAPEEASKASRRVSVTPRMSVQED